MRDRMRCWHGWIVALSDAMRRVLHHPDFQAVEALWRGVELLVRRIETDARLQIVLYDISAEALAADVARSNALEELALYELLVEQPALDADLGSLSLIAGLYLLRGNATTCRLAWPHRADRRCRRRAIPDRHWRGRTENSDPRMASADPKSMDGTARASGQRLSRSRDAAVPAAHALWQTHRPDQLLRLRGIHAAMVGFQACYGAIRPCCGAF